VRDIDPPRASTQALGNYSQTGLHGPVPPSTARPSARPPAARREARRAGKSVANLFSGTTFVPRTTADRWHSEGKTEGAHEVAEILGRHMTRAARGSTGKPVTTPQRFFKSVASPDELARFNDAMAQGFYTEAAHIYVSVMQGDVLAQQILAASALRDSGGPTRSAPTGLAKQILAAGVARRKRMGDA
jgi:hypothetical protein